MYISHSVHFTLSCPIRRVSKFNIKQRRRHHKHGECGARDRNHVGEEPNRHQRPNFQEAAGKRNGVGRRRDGHHKGARTRNGGGQHQQQRVLIYTNGQRAQNGQQYIGGAHVAREFSKKSNCVY